ncbi:hypothetical protein DL96DRAFT_1465984, partial [Flagelloscypha sp. PMI_526]
HARVRNVIERIFGIMKKRFKILMTPPHMNLDVQARIPPALAAVHNFIIDNDPDDLQDYMDICEDPSPGIFRTEGQLAVSRTSAREKQGADTKRANVALAMWNAYVTQQ